MRLSQEEIRYMRELARKMADICQDPIWTVKDQLWRKKNSLKKVRPLILSAIPETAWHEIIPEESLKIQDPLFKSYERYLRRKIYKYDFIRDDDVLTNKIYVPIHYKVTDWMEGRKKPYSDQADHAAAYEPFILEYDDVKKLKMPQIVDVNWSQSQKDLETVQEIFGDLLDVELGAPYYSATDTNVMGIGNGLVDLLCEFRGLENIFYDLYDAPEFIHELMEYITQGSLNYLDQMERENLLRLNNVAYMPGADTALNSNGLGISDELPGDHFDPNHITTKNLWGYVQAQEFTVVSEDMLDEYITPYHMRIAERFGLVCYGCCENEDKKWDNVIKRIPNLRELSVPYSCNLEIAAHKISDKYVYSWKPRATMVTLFNEEETYNEIREGFEIAKDCHVVLSMRDTQTLNGKPESITRWTEIAMELAKEY